MRFLHLTGAAIGIGGLLMSAAVLPKLPAESREIAARQIGKWIGIGLTVAVLAGVYNMKVDATLHSDPAYINILMTKATLGLLVFIFSVFVFHPAPFFKPFAERRTGWSIALLIAALLVLHLGNKLHTFYTPTDPRPGTLTGASMR